MSNNTENIIEKSSSEAESNIPKFNIRARYDDLNTAQKSIVRKQFQESFGGNIQSFYYKLSSDNLLADEIMFFSSIFDCKIQDLYTPGQEPAIQLSIHELYRKAKGFKFGA